MLTMFVTYHYIAKGGVQVHRIGFHQILGGPLLFFAHVAIEEGGDGQIVVIPLAVVHLAVADLKKGQNIGNGTVQNILDGGTVTAEGGIGDQDELADLGQPLAHVLEAVLDDAAAGGLQPAPEAADAVTVDLVGIDEDVPGGCGFFNVFRRNVIDDQAFHGIPPRWILGLL